MLAKFSERWPTAFFNEDIWVNGLALVDVGDAREASEKALGEACAPSVAEFHALLRPDRREAAKAAIARIRAEHFPDSKRAG
jgi:hypothetical protein